ncbi:response regulator [Pseudoduganella sp. FT93W]|uniref:Response regulator n=1 Tax=Duganella fentianensis TaxID=2692177 RepID=A0A845I382_9BURK|nr:response regulator [Duganella fentianensis]
MRILVIEDEIKSAEYLQNGLTESGYVVDVACNGRDGLYMASEFKYDLILLDVMMPEMDGWEVMRHLRGKETPVLFLTARGTLEDRLKGLDLGTDDYLVKPFSFAELLARIRVALRRGRLLKQEDVVEESNCVTGFNACFPLDRGRKVTHLPARPRKQLCQLVASERKSVNSQL